MLSSNTLAVHFHRHMTRWNVRRLSRRMPSGCKTATFSPLHQACIRILLLPPISILHNHRSRKSSQGYFQSRCLGLCLWRPALEKAIRFGRMEFRSIRRVLPLLTSFVPSYYSSIVLFPFILLVSIRFLPLSTTHPSWISARQNEHFHYSLVLIGSFRSCRYNHCHLTMRPSSVNKSPSHTSPFPPFPLFTGGSSTDCCSHSIVHLTFTILDFLSLIMIYLCAPLVSLSCPNVLIGFDSYGTIEIYTG